MFFHLITHARDVWYSSKDCTVKELISYIDAQNVLRDAQIEAIKMYLYLKIKCENKPLWQLFYEGYFCTLNPNDLPIDIISGGGGVIHPL